MTIRAGTIALARPVLLALAMGVGTWVLGWWAVPAIGAAWGLLHRGGAGRGREAAADAAIAWLALLAIDAASGALGRVADVLGGIVRVPGAVLAAATVVFAAALAGLAAYLTGATGSRVR